METKFSNFDDLISFIDNADVSEVENLLQKHGFKFTEETNEKDLFKYLSTYTLKDSVKFGYESHSYKVGVNQSKYNYDKIVNSVEHLSKVTNRNQYKSNSNLLSYELEDAV